MIQHTLENFGAYQKATQLFDLVVVDMAELCKAQRCFRLVAQQVASADSICANIEEGYVLKDEPMSFDNTETSPYSPSNP